MNKKLMIIARILVITVLVVSFASGIPHEAYAEGAPEILAFQGDRYLYPSQASVDLFVYLDREPSKVELRYYNGSSWVKFADCTPEGAYNDYWTYTLKQDHMPKPKMQFKYYISFNNNSSVILSPDFVVEWTSFRRVSRVFGSDRFQTAIKVADKQLELKGTTKHKYAIIASGTDFADALSGSYISSSFYSAPIYLVGKSTQSMEDAATEIAQDLESGGVAFILGGFGAVPQEMEDILQNHGIAKGRTRRFAGTDRYDTNLKILRFCDYYMEPNEVMLCSGTSFADALSGSASGKPIMLVGQTLTPDQEAYLKEKEKFVYLIGGTGAVSQAIEDKIFKEYGYWFQRLAGDNRYLTSREVAEYFFPYQPYYVVFAYGRNFPDGLAGGPLAQALNAPLLLVENGSYGPAEQYCKVHDPRYGIVLGGPTLISDEVADKLIFR